METKILEEIGLTPGEIKVYLALLELGPSTAGAALKKAGVQNSVFHFCVNRLMEKGLVSYVKKGKVRIYAAADPESLLAHFKEREKEVERLLPELKARQAFAKERNEVEIFEGMKGVITLLHALIDDARKGDEYLFFSADVAEKNKEIQKFYERYDARRKSKGLVVKGIAPTRLKSLFTSRKYLKMRYIDFPVPANTGICGDRMALISWGEKPLGVLIQAKNIVEKQKEFFYGIWNLAK